MRVLQSAILSLSAAALFVAIPTNRACATEAPICNGSVELCAKRFNEVIFPTTHNSFNYGVGLYPYVFVNQQHSIPTQLRRGIRAFTLDLHHYNGWSKQKRGAIYVCHANCKLGGQPLIDVLAYFKAYLDTHPTDVLTLILESYVNPERSTPVFDAAGLSAYAHTQNPALPWPTLQEMIDTGKRLVILADRSQDQPSWYMDVWKQAVETSFQVEKVEEFNCRFNRGDARNSLFILNHFIARPLFRMGAARRINSRSFLKRRIEECRNETGKLPNFVMVDFSGLGQLVSTIGELNQSR